MPKGPKDVLIHQIYTKNALYIKNIKYIKTFKTLNTLYIKKIHTIIQKVIKNRKNQSNHTEIKRTPTVLVWCLYHLECAYQACCIALLSGIKMRWNKNNNSRFSSVLKAMQLPNPAKNRWPLCTLYTGYLAFKLETQRCGCLWGTDIVVIFCNLEFHSTLCCCSLTIYEILNSPLVVLGTNWKPSFLSKFDAWHSLIQLYIYYLFIFFLIVIHSLPCAPTWSWGRHFISCRVQNVLIDWLNVMEKEDFWWRFLDCWLVSVLYVRCNRLDIVWLKASVVHWVLM